MALMNPKKINTNHIIPFVCLICAFALSSCTTPAPQNTNNPSTQKTTQVGVSTTTPTSAPPTPTPVPAAFSVNGIGYPLVDFQADLARFQAAQKGLGKTISDADAQKQVTDDLISQMLLAQAAEKDGFTLTDADLQKHVDDLAAKAGGSSGIQKWETDHGYTDKSLRQSLRLQIAAAWERDKIIAAVPQKAAQVHAIQILVPDLDTAKKVQDRLKQGVTFAAEALRYDPEKGGDLGWFPKGYLNFPEVEQAAFSLQPEQVSDPIQTKLGYELVQVVESDPQREISTNVRLVLQDQVLQAWVKDARSKANVVLQQPS